MRRVLVRVGLLMSLGVAAAVPSLAHPTDRELREAMEDRLRCEATPGMETAIDLARLGMSAAELQAVAKGVRRESPVASSDPGALHGATRWVRDTTGDLAGIEYELWQDRVYLIRWKLSQDYERPVLDELVRRGETCFGRPDYDQKFEAKPGSPKATLRRIRWTHGERWIELRQLHPLRGGPIYLSVSLISELQKLSASKLALLPEPDRSEPWWQRSMRPPEPATPQERDRLGDAFLGLLSQLDH